VTAAEPSASPPSLPTGTVTFLFTDIEGSTRRVAELGDAAYGELLATEARLVAEAAIAQGGVPFGSEGDAHFVAFPSAAAGIRAAVAAQRAIAAHAWPGDPVRVRMGLHTGEAQVVAGDYVGLEVHRAARIASTAHGGQVVVSEPARVLAGDLGDDIRFRDLGDHRLKDLPKPERVLQVEAPGLDRDFPPLRSLDAMPNNLPPQLTSFVGRDEVARVLELLTRARLLTLVGPGGTGKTRLSLAVAAELVPHTPGGVWFVPLASVTEPDLIASSIATAVGLLSPARTPLERILEHFADRTALLVLDNFEQVVAGAPIVAELLRGAPGLRVVVSSRAPLRIAGEQEFAVPPLPVPPAGETDPEAIAATEAVRLFVERAMAVRPGFAVTADNATAIAAVVRGLDGLPLAIELAAARVRVLTPSAMVARLGDRMALLSAGGRDLPERQRTLRGAIAWSHDLLDDQCRRLFARLSVFEGGATLETAEAVCGSDEDGSPDLDVLARLESLAEQSLIRVLDDVHGDPRFVMLHTIREYAAEQLADGGERRVTAFRDRHCQSFLELAQAASAGLHAADRAGALDRLEDDHDNLRAALVYAIETGDGERASGLLGALFRFWHMRGHLVEARTRANAVLAMPSWGEEPSVARLRALEVAGGLAYWSGDIVDAHRRYLAAEQEARKLGDDRAIANALYNRGFAPTATTGVEQWAQSLAESGTPLAREALEIFQRLGDEAGAARCQWVIGMGYLYGGDPVAAIPVLTQAIAAFERLDDSFDLAWALFTRGITHDSMGDRIAAVADYATALTAFEVAGDVSGITLVLNAFGATLFGLGRTREAYLASGVGSRWTAETGTHLATITPSRLLTIPDRETPDPELRAAFAEGAAMPREAGERLLAAMMRELAASSTAGPASASVTA
jgi:predicted ATPase/class 3 adenylate cyclase